MVKSLRFPFGNFNFPLDLINKSNSLVDFNFSNPFNEKIQLQFQKVSKRFLPGALNGSIHGIAILPLMGASYLCASIAENIFGNITSEDWAPQTISNLALASGLFSVLTASKLRKKEERDTVASFIGSTVAMLAANQYLDSGVNSFVRLACVISASALGGALGPSIYRISKKNIKSENFL